MRSIGSIAMVAALTVQCADATAVRVTVFSEVPCDKEAQVALVVAPTPAELATRAPSATSTRCDPATGAMGQVVLLPSAGDDVPLSFQLAARVDGQSPETCTQPASAGQCIAARRQLRFVPHSTLDMRVDLRVSCLGISCPLEQTCVRGSCVPAESACAGGSCGDETGLATTSGGWCASQPPHFFCSDFDSSPLGTGWDPLTPTSGATLALDSADSASPRFSLLLTAANASASLKKSLPAGTQWVRAGMDGKFQTFVAGTDAVKFLAVVSEPPPPGYDSYRVIVGSEGPTIFGEWYTPSGGSNTVKFKSYPATLDQWARYELEVDTKARTANLYVGGKLLETVPLTPTAFGPLAVRVGSVFTSGTIATRADNVTIDVR